MEIQSFNDLESSFDEEQMKNKYQNVFSGSNFKAITLLQKVKNYEKLYKKLLEKLYQYN